MGVGIEHAYDRISEDGEIGAGTLAVDWVGGGVGIGEMSGGGRSEVASGGESPDADAVGSKTETGGMEADVTDSALGVPKFDGVMIFGAEEVFENVGADAEIVEPSGNLHAFMIHS